MLRFCVFLLIYFVLCYRIIIGSNSDYVLYNVFCFVVIVWYIEEDFKVYDLLNFVGGSRKVVIVVDELWEVFLFFILF